MKKIFALCTTLALLSLPAAAAGSGESTDEVREPVTFLFWPGTESEAMQKMIDHYNSGPGEADAVEVDMLLFSRQGFFDKLLADLAAGSSEFDLNLVTTYSLGRHAPYLSSLSPYIESNPSDTFIPATLDSLTFNGEQYGVPTDVSLNFTFYRRDLMDQLLSDPVQQARYAEISREYLGIESEPVDPQEWSWNDYAAAALFFTRSVNSDSPTEYGTVLQLKNLIFNIMIWQSTMVSNGGNWMSDDGSITINSEAARRGLEVYQTIIDAGATPPGSLNYEFAETNEALRSGQAASALQWNSAYSTLKDREQSPAVADLLEAAPLPAGSEGHRTHVHSLGAGMNAAGEHKEAAGKFVNYLLTQEAMRIYAEAGGSPPVMPVMEAMRDRRPDFPLMARFLEDYAYVVNGGTAAYAVPVYEIMAEEFSAVWAGDQSIDDALRAAETRMARAAAE